MVLPTGVFVEPNKSDPDEEPSSSTVIFNKPSENHVKILETIVSNLQLSGALVANSKSDYYHYISAGDFFREQRATPLPLYLTLKIYGISSLIPGDIFKVDYLPKKYRNNVYFQVITVSHNVDSSGWYTTLETQFRIRTTKKRIKVRRYDKPIGIFYTNQYIEKMSNVPEITVLDRKPPSDD